MYNLVIKTIKDIFQDTLPASDKRCTIQPLELIAALVCGFSTREGRMTTIAGLRRSLMEYTQKKLARGSFWERLATKRMITFLRTLLGKLMTAFCLRMGIGVEISKKLGVNSIFLLDSCSFSLPGKASEKFPAPRNHVLPAGVKVHALYDLLGGIIKWFDITSATTHDRKGFPPLEQLRGVLIIFDLAYWDYQLLKDIMDVGGFFLSRVKTNANITILEIVSGISKDCIGFSLNSGKLDVFRREIVEFLGEFTIPKTGEKFTSRVVGFWNQEENQYHWYTTNLKVPASVIYTLYRLRWQIELH